MSHYTPKELSVMLAGMGDDAEVLLAVNAGQVSTMFWTEGVLAVKSPSGTPEPLRWGRAMLAGFQDARGGRFPGDEPEKEVPPPIDGAPTAPGH